MVQHNADRADLESVFDGYTVLSYSLRLQLMSFSGVYLGDLQKNKKQIVEVGI